MSYRRRTLANMTEEKTDGAAKTPARRVMFVHAHPDDETVGTGLTMARYAAEGALVTLVTCTLGEEGEIRVPALDQLAADQADQLGGYRIGELAAACDALGVTDQLFLGGVGRYRDSGMMGTDANKHPRCFWAEEVDTAAAFLVEVIRDRRPQVLVTYDPNGFYGHPDHIQAHRVAMRAIELAADGDFDAPGEPWQVAKVYWTAVPRSYLAEGLERFADAADNPFDGATSVDDLPFGSADEEIAAEIEGSAFVQRKVAAMRAHASQIAADDWLFRLTELGGDAAEHYQLAVGARATTGLTERGWETDLFVGLELTT